MKKLLVSSLGVLATALFCIPLLTFASNAEADIEFFYSTSCPHCHKEQAFLDSLENTYPNLHIERYDVADLANHPRMRELLEQHNGTRYFGSVPLTFIGDQFILGFDTADTTGRQIEEVLGLIEANDTPQEPSDEQTILGISRADYSLPATAIILGFLDGFNVCSLGALVLILGLVLTLSSRKAIILYGSFFIITTALIYGLMIFFWHQLFSLFAPFLPFLQLIIATVGIGGGLFFLKEFWRFKKHGVTCATGESPFISRLSARVQRIFNESTSTPALIGGVLLFASVLTIVEFPCSAAVPVTFAGMLATANLSPLTYISLIALFVLFYMLDELIVFGIASVKMKVWLMSPKFTLWAALVEGLALLAFGLYYLFALLGVI